MSWVLPIVVFILLGQYLSKKMMERAGGGVNAMSFGMGKSNAKVYVKSSDGIKFSDVAGEDEAKESLKEVVDYLHNPQKYKEVGAAMPKGMLLVGPPGTGKTMGDASLICSAETQTQIDQQVVALVKRQHEKVLQILTENRRILDKLAQYLYENETITGETFMKILEGYSADNMAAQSQIEHAGKRTDAGNACVRPSYYLCLHSTMATIAIASKEINSGNHV